MHYATVKECVAVAIVDINPEYPLITQPDFVCLSYVLGYVAFRLLLNVFVADFFYRQS